MASWAIDASLKMSGATFAEIYLPLRDVVRKVCIQLLGNEEDAEDLTQDVYLKLWEERNRLEDIASPKAYVIRVARNRCLDRLKTPAMQLRNELQEDEMLSVVDATAGPDEQLIAKEQSHRLQQWVNKLKEPKRSIFILRQFEMLSNEETAEKLGLQEATVRSTLSRLRKEARAYFAEEQ